jgi:hypothetical protein
MVPAQIGALDASFALAAGPLRIDVARALTIPIAMHAVQLTWALIGALMPGHARPTGPAPVVVEPTQEQALTPGLPAAPTT